MGRLLTLDDVGDIPEQSGEWTVPFVVGFVLLSVSPNREQQARLGGSGTLVQASGKYGILTADHVLTNLPAKGELGLVLPRMNEPVFDRHILSAEHLTYIRVGSASFTADGPDIGLIRLSTSDAQRLQSNKAFYSLSKRRDAMMENPKAIDDGGWFLAGMVDEWTEEQPGELGYHKVKQFQGTFGAGVVTSESQRGQFDYLAFEARFGELYGGPENYRGVSGGGLWQMALTEEHGEIKIRDGLLSGVAFFQTPANGGIDIACHGRRSIYGPVCEALSQS